MAVYTSKYYPFLERQTNNEADDNWTFKSGDIHKNTLLKGLEVNKARIGGNWYVLFPNADMKTYTSKEKLDKKYLNTATKEYELPDGARLVESTVKNHDNTHRNHKQDVNTAQYGKEGQIPVLLANAKYVFLGYTPEGGEFIAFDSAKPISRIGNKERNGIFTHGQARAINTFLGQYRNNKTLAQLDLEDAKAEPVVPSTVTTTPASSSTPPSIRTATPPPHTPKQEAEDNKSTDTKKKK